MLDSDVVLMKMVVVTINPDCKTVTLAQKQEVYSLFNGGGVEEKLMEEVVMMVMLMMI